MLISKANLWDIDSTNTEKNDLNAQLIALQIKVNNAFDCNNVEYNSTSPLGKKIQKLLDSNSLSQNIEIKENWFRANQASAIVNSLENSLGNSAAAVVSSVVTGGGNHFNLENTVQMIRSHKPSIKPLIAASIKHMTNQPLKKYAQEILEGKGDISGMDGKIESTKNYNKNMLIILKAYKEDPPQSKKKSKMKGTVQKVTRKLDEIQNLVKKCAEKECQNDLEKLSELLTDNNIIDQIDPDNLINCVKKRLECLKYTQESENVKIFVCQFKKLLDSRNNEDKFMRLYNFYSNTVLTENTEVSKELKVYLYLIQQKFFLKPNIHSNSLSPKNIKDCQPKGVFGRLFGK